MKNIYLIANWKMNPVSEKEAKALAKGVATGIRKIKPKRTEVVLCPPFPYIKSIMARPSAAIPASKTGLGTYNPPVRRSPSVGGKPNFSLGAQNCHYENSGAYTGETSPKMLEDMGCKYVIIGHSERRHYFKEDSEFINKKINAVFSSKMIPVLAVGEREGESVNVVVEQLKESLRGISATRVKQLIIAYEPVWAIGTGKAATVNDAMSARLLIQKTLSELYSRNTAESVPILYGGSTNSKNISSFIIDAGMNGALVGGSSLKAEEFVKMIEKL
ncbi:MAG: triose-phosphate isomerase [Candidatus Spechtbacterales bacterium]